MRQSGCSSSVAVKSSQRFTSARARRAAASRIRLREGSGTEPRKGRENFVGGLRPYQGLRVVVVRFDVMLDRDAELASACVASASQRLVGELGKPFLPSYGPDQGRSPWSGLCSPSGIV